MYKYTNNSCFFRIVMFLLVVGAAGLGTAATAAVASVGGGAALALKGAVNGIKSFFW